MSNDTKDPTYHYEVAPLGLRLGALTYKSSQPIAIGQYVQIKIKSKELTGVILKEVQKPSFKCSEISLVLNCFLPQTSVQTASFIASYYVCEIGESLNLFEPFDDTEYTQEKFSTTSTFELSSAQKEAFDFCINRHLSLIFGDTGSGKTEIYIKLIEETLKNGKNAVLLLPEISLTPQIQQRLKLVFGELVDIWHSKQSKKTKNDILQRIKSGKCRILAGPRSVLFLPHHNIGLIIVDEEHDDSFKSEQRPRYNARDMAIYIGSRQEIKVVLGSATPSISSYKNIEHVRLRGGFYEANKKWIFDESSTDFGSSTEQYLEKNVKNSNSQAIIFLPTRANFKYVVCNHCYKSIECPYCSVAMSLHLEEKLLKCHYCNFAEPIPNHCPSCKDGLLGFHRIGTSEVLHELSSRLHDIRFAKFDRDEITTEAKLKKTLHSFNKGDIDVLIGTQMLSKGHDYHNVDSAIILGIDSIIAQNDFRAREKCVSLLTQIAGRAGRKNSANIIVQTKNREFFEKYITDYEEFLKDEMQYRQKLYPPFKRVARLIFADKYQKKAEQNMHKTVQMLKNCNIEIVGFGEAAIAKIGGKYRFDILLRGDNAKALLDAIYSLELNLFEADIDPISFT